MSRETKIGLLVGLGIIMVFALILEWRLNSAGHANLGEEPQGSNMAQVQITDKDPLDSGPSPSSDMVVQSSDISPLASTDVSADTLESRNENQGVMVADRGGDVARTDRVVSTTSPATDLVPEPVQSDVVAPPPEETPTYTVKAGDNGVKIAEKVFGRGQGSKWKLIAKLNPKVDPTRLKPGMKLVIPAEVTEKTSEPTREATSPREDSTSGKQTYVVAKGDTLGTISTKVYGTCKKWQLIAAANKGVASNSLKVGTKLTIPEAPAASPAAPATTPTTAPVTPEPSPTGPSALPSDYPDTMTAGGGSGDLGLDDHRGSSRTMTIAATSETYKVQAGDTLGEISRKVLGSSARWKEIYDLNKTKLPNPKALTIGQELRLPSAARVAMADVAAIR